MKNHLPWWKASGFLFLEKEGALSVYRPDELIDLYQQLKLIAKGFFLIRPHIELLTKTYH